MPGCGINHRQAAPSKNGFGYPPARDQSAGHAGHVPKNAPERTSTGRFGGYVQLFHPGLCVVGGETGGDFPPVRADDGPVVPKKRYLAGRKKGEKIGDTSRQHLPGGPNGGGRPTVGPWRRPGRVRAPERDGLRAAAALAWPGQGHAARRQGALRVPVDVLGVGGGQAPPPRCPGWHCCRCPPNRPRLGVGWTFWGVPAAVPARTLRRGAALSPRPPSARGRR